MNPVSSKSVPTKLLVCLALVVLAFLGLRTISTTETWTHLAAGRWIADNGVPEVDGLSFAQAGKPWIDSSWLYDRALYLCWKIGGASGTTLVHVAMVLLAFMVLLPTCRKWAGDLSISFALLLSTWLLAPRFEVRPLLAALPLSAVFVAVLSRKTRMWVLWAVLLPLQLLWTNLHGSFVLGPVIALAFTVEAFLAKGQKEENNDEAATGVNTGAVSLLLLTAGLLAVTLLNPYGIKLHAQVVRSWNSAAALYTREWISPFNNMFPPSSNRVLVVLSLVLGAIGLVAQKRKLPLALTSLAVMSAFVVVLRPASLLLDLFSLLAFPFFCVSLDAVGEFCENRLPRLFPVPRELLPKLAAPAALVLCAASLFVIVTNRYYVREGSASSFGLGVAEGLLPEAALDVLEREDFPKRALNLPMDGGFLAWSLPERQVFADQRAEVYGAEFYETLYNGLLRGDPGGLEEMAQEWEPGAIIVNACARNAGIAVRSLLMGGHWSLTYFDGTTAVFVESVSHYEELITDKSLQEEGLRILMDEYEEYEARLGGFVHPAISPRLVGAGTMFLTLNRYREAAAVFSALTRGAPSMIGAWLSLGICQRELGQVEIAIDSLLQAQRLLSKRQKRLRARTSIELSRAYAQLGRNEEAEAAFAAGEQIDPGLAKALGNPLKQD